MIPLVLPPLYALSVLVTRPAHQATSLCERISGMGGIALPLPMLDIEALLVDQSQFNEPAYDLVIVTSSNAVRHGLPLWRAQQKAKFAVIGNSTAAALTELGGHVDIVPLHASSESLLEHATLQSPSRVLLIRGAAGRELLPETLTARGAQVHIAEVYRRVTAQHDDAARHTLLQQWQEHMIDVVVVTSVEILDALHELLESLRSHAGATLPPLPLLAGSTRIAARAQELDWQGPCLVSASPEDNDVLVTLQRWHTRARA
jgi:uroporphyrinogen-III synthase